MPPPKNLGIDQRIAVIKLTPQTLLIPARKEIVADAASGDAWTSMTPWQGSRNGVERSTLGDIGNDIGILETPSPVLIRIIGDAPPYGLKLSQEIGDICKNMSGHALMGRPASRLETMALVIHSYVLV